MARRALSKSELETAAGVELLGICQSVTADGRLDQGEVDDLRRWLEANRDSAMPGAAFLRDAIGAILADGIVTDSERRELQRVVEAVLPPALRPAAAAARRDALVADRAARQRAESMGAGEWTFVVAGVRHDNRAEAVRDHLREGDLVLLSRETFEGANSPGARATAVRIARTRDLVGYVPKSISYDLSMAIDAGWPVEARCVSIVDGPEAPFPTVTARVVHQQASVDQPSQFDGPEPSPAPWDLTSEPPKRRRARQKTSKEAGAGAGTALIVIVGFVAFKLGSWGAWIGGLAGVSLVAGVAHKYLGPDEAISTVAGTMLVLATVSAAFYFSNWWVLAIGAVLGGLGAWAFKPAPA